MSATVTNENPRKSPDEKKFANGDWSLWKMPRKKNISAQVNDEEKDQAEAEIRIRTSLPKNRLPDVRLLSPIPTIGERTARAKPMLMNINLILTGMSGSAKLGRLMSGTFAARHVINPSSMRVSARNIKAKIPFFLRVRVEPIGLEVGCMESLTRIR
jgi:hypothetical protein